MLSSRAGCEGDNAGGISPKSGSLREEMERGLKDWELKQLPIQYDPVLRQTVTSDLEILALFLKGNDPCSEGKEKKKEEKMRLGKREGCFERRFGGKVPSDIKGKNRRITRWGKIKRV